MKRIESIGAKFMQFVAVSIAVSNSLYQHRIGMEGFSLVFAAAVLCLLRPALGWLENNWSAAAAADEKPDEAAAALSS